MNKLIRDIWKAIKGAISKIKPDLQPRYKEIIKDLKIKKYKEGKSVTLLALNKEMAKDLNILYLKIIQDFFNKENGVNYKFKATHAGTKAAPIVLPLICTAAVLGVVGFGAYNCYKASLPAEKKLALSGGSTILISEPNKAGKDSKSWAVSFDNETISIDSVKLSLDKAGDNPIPENVSISKAGVVSWTANVATGRHKFIVKAVYEKDGKTYYASSDVINLVIENA